MLIDERNRGWPKTETGCTDGGFTLVELVIILVLIGIVGAVIIPRFIGSSAFESRSAQAGLISTIRTAQQAALGRDNVSFRINTVGNDWQFQTMANAVEIRAFTTPLDSLTLETGSAASSSDTCSTAPGDFDIGVDTDFQLSFDRLGNLVSFTNDGTTELATAPAFNGVRICLNNNVDLSVCVSRAGYAYAGDCDA